MKVLLTGGGTLGSVSPLLAIVPELRKRGHELVWVGTPNGPERLFIEQMNIPFYSMVSPKVHRFLTWKHLLLPYTLLTSLHQAKKLIKQLQPDVIVSAGGFTAVTLTWVGKGKQIPSVIHQQDIAPGLANNLMAPFANAITVTFESSLHHFNKKKSEWIGNPVRDLIPTTAAFDWDDEYPTVLIFGGGTGARALNELVTAELCQFAQIIHVKGKGREGEMQQFEHERYHAFELLEEEMKEALQKADVVVARAGLGTISELAALGKPSIIIPMPDTHQEANTDILGKAGAAVILDQRAISAGEFAEQVQALVEDSERQSELSAAIQTVIKPGANMKLVDIIEKQQ